MISGGKQYKNLIDKVSDAGPFFSLLCKRIHTVVAATVDDDGQPVTCALDIMDWDDDNLYFLTARGKGFYRRLKKRAYIALTGTKGNDTLSSIAISVRGNAEELDDAILAHLLKKNPYMYEIYSTRKSARELHPLQGGDELPKMPYWTEQSVVIK